jgi:predicted ATP-grasp superfamily ATP-dependent carboligase
VILGDEPLIKLMNEEVHEESLFAKMMPIINIEHRYMLSSKQGLADFCEKIGIDTPSYTIYNDTQDLEKIKSKLNFPVINKLDFSWGGVSMFVSYSYEEFLSNLHKIPENQNVLIQEYIEGNEIPVEALFYRGELLVYNTSKIIEYDKDKFSYSTRRSYYDNTTIKPLLINLGKKLGLNGFANIAYMHDTKKDKYYLIEVDTRPNSWIAYGRFIGRDFSKGVKRILNGDYVYGYQEMVMKFSYIEVALFDKDIRRALWKREIKGIMRWVLNHNNYWHYLPFYDKKLTKRILKGIWSDIFMHKWKKITGQFK